ncbi:MAG TPA: hypothetical protein PKK12_15315, partial [Candidatus Aminicenantes bacterium]|nr:hypothetical protein [Candidatus Aminicenantes bacterium]
MPYTFWTIAGLTILLLLAPTPSPAHSATPGLPVPFLEAPPQIDGELDATLANIPAASFAAVKTTSPQCLVVPVHYRLAYGSTFLYLYIEVADEQPIHRDRGYQNGDGFHMVLAAPRPDDGPSDEFYVLGFAGGEAESASFDRFVWYHDIALSFTPLSEVTRFARHSGGGKTGYELLLPWSEIPPYHPWTSSAIGFNLCFVKAVGTTDKVYHFVHTDDRMQWEQSPRLYEPLEFLPPVLTGGQQTVLMPDRGNGKAGETLTATQVTLAATAMTVPLNVRLLTGDGAAVTTRSEFVCHSGLNHRRVELPTASLPAEGIRLLWSTHGTAVEGENALSILPATEPA